MIYVYCVTDREPGSETKWESDRGGLYTLGLRGLFAVVREVRGDDFDEGHIHQRLADPDWLTSKVLEHEKTVERIMVDSPLLPFRFATVFESEENVMKMLDGNSEAFSAIIRVFGDKEEWGVRIYGAGEAVRTAVVNTDAEVKNLDRLISGATPGRAYILKKKREELVRSRAEQAMYEQGERCLEALVAASVSVKINGLLPRETTSRSDEMLLNAAFLVEKEKGKIFRDTVEELGQRYGVAGFRLDLTGPWPPYNFCSSVAESGL